MILYRKFHQSESCSKQIVPKEIFSSAHYARKKSKDIYIYTAAQKFVISKIFNVF